jgi:hydrogenase assembly chaperone HypC/HupF
MCLAIPGKVVEIFSNEGMHMARVQFGGVTREACLNYVPETRVGEYVLVHVGFAISRGRMRRWRRSTHWASWIRPLSRRRHSEIPR